MRFFTQPELNQLAELINTDWKYSWHRKIDDEISLVNKISDQIKDQRLNVMKRLSGLNQADDIIQSIMNRMENAN